MDTGEQDRRRLLFGESLSPKLRGLVAEHFPGSAEVRECRLIGQGDGTVWDYARARVYTTISKDSDFRQRGLLYGPATTLTTAEKSSSARPVSQAES